MTVAMVRTVVHSGETYKSIMVWCPGCEVPLEGSLTGETHGGLHMLPIEGDATKRPTWSWNGNLEQVTLTPSILSQHTRGDVLFKCHSFLTDGVWNFLSDCTHALVNQHVPMVPLPQWVLDE